MKKGNRFAYAKKGANTSQQASKTHLKIDSKSIKLYQDCRVPLDIFLDCLFDKEYDRLIIKGEPSEENLITAWESIYLEFSELTTNGSGNELFQKTVEINYLSTKLYVVRKILQHLYIAYSEVNVKILYHYGVAGTLNSLDSYEERCKKLNLISKKIRTWETDMQTLHKEFEQLQGEGTANQGGRDYFEDGLSSLSAFRKYSILEKDITVRQFIKGLNQLEQYAIKLATQQ